MTEKYGPPPWIDFDTNSPQGPITWWLHLIWAVLISIVLTYIGWYATFWLLVKIF